MSLLSIARGPIGRIARSISAPTMDRLAVTALVGMVSYGVGFSYEHVKVVKLEDQAAYFGATSHLLQDQRDEWRTEFDHLESACFSR